MDRMDVDLGFGEVTRKRMENGETRTRLRLTTGYTITITEMPSWDISNGAPWQEGHFHKGLYESYLLLQGWMLYVEERNVAGFTPRFLYQQESLIFPPKREHWILLGPDSVVQTTQWGMPVPNPDRKGLDWWPASDEAFEKSLRRLDQHGLHSWQEQEKYRRGARNHPRAGSG